MKFIVFHFYLLHSFFKGLIQLFSLDEEFSKTQQFLAESNQSLSRENSEALLSFPPSTHFFVRRPIFLPLFDGNIWIAAETLRQDSSLSYTFVLQSDDFSRASLWKNLEDRSSFGDFDLRCHFEGCLFLRKGLQIVWILYRLYETTRLLHTMFWLSSEFLRYFFRERNWISSQFFQLGQYLSQCKSFFAHSGSPIARILSWRFEAALFYHIINVSCGPTILRSVCLLKKLEHRLFFGISQIFLIFFILASSSIIYFDFEQR